MIEIVVFDRQTRAIADDLRAADLPVRIVPVTDRRALPLAMATADALVTLGFELDASILAAAPRLKWIQLLSSGWDHLAPLLAPRPALLLTNARGLHGPPVAEMAMLLMLALARDFPKLVRQQQAQEWGGPSTGAPGGSLLAHKTVGIAGVGTIGECLARRCQAFEMTTIGYGSERRAAGGLDRFFTFDELPDTVGSVDFLVLLTPLRPATTGLIDDRVLAAMKPGAFLVNVGRGGLVREDALVAALDAGRLAGAALDTFAEEPLSQSSPFWAMPNVIVTPHAAGSYDGARRAVTRLVAENIRRFAMGEPDAMTNIVSTSAPGA